MIPFCGATWAPRGCTPRLVHRFSWSKRCAIAALTADGRLVVATRATSFHGPAIVAFLEQLLATLPGRLLVVWDGAPAHRAKVVAAFAAAHAARLELHRLPAYCPEFNPVEWFWARLKCVELRGVAPADLAALDAAIARAVARIAARPDLRRGFLRGAKLPETDWDELA